MVDFLSAVKRGIEAADQAAKDREEIAAVFAELNAQLSQATNDTVEISRREVLNAFEAITALSAGRVKEKKWCLVAASKITNASTEIAQWEQARTAYPCAIRFADNFFSCTNRQGLERALAMLLQDPIVGAVISRYMEPPSQESSGEREP